VPISFLSPGLDRQLLDSLPATNMVFGLGTITIHSGFAASTIAVYNNVAKQVLFKLAALLLQLFIFKIFALLASSRRAFTSYLMFTEDYIQKTLFIISRGFSAGGIIVFFLTLLLFVGTWFDALLWGLDSPGYLPQKSNVTGAMIADRLLPEPGYLVFSTSTPGDIGPLEARLVDMMGANLFEPGVNFSLTGVVDRGTPKTVAATQPFTKTGPRIWLDSEGFSVSADTYITISSNDTDVLKSLNCPWQTLSDSIQGWNCTFDNPLSYKLVVQNKLGRPEIHWDDDTDKLYRSQYISPTREDNPWNSLGTGGDTALMKQMFTVTKGRMRHTFIETAWKACMLTSWEAPFSLEEVTDLVKRGWSTDPVDQTNPIISKFAHSIIDARRQNSSGTFGLTAETETSVSQVNYELLNVESVPGEVEYSLFRASVVNITLVRSDELPEPVVPLEPCDKYYSNIALGGKVRETDCYLSSVGISNQEGHRFYGQVDTSAFLVLNGILGEGRFNSSDKALNQQGFEWVVKNDERLSDLVLSRGAILALGPQVVMVEVTSIQPAISQLQILLIAICAVLAGVSWLSLIFFAKAHYSSSLLANLLATTMASSGVEGVKGGKPRYLIDCPEIMLTNGPNSRTSLTTTTGVFKHVESEGPSASDFLMSDRKLDSDADNILSKSTAVSQCEVGRR
jgi:hypothetical protein